MIRLHNISLSEDFDRESHVNQDVFRIKARRAKRLSQQGTQDTETRTPKRWHSQANNSLPTTIPAEAPDTAASLKLPLPPLAGCDSGGKCGVPGVRGLLKNSSRGNQPTTDGSLKLHHLPFPQAQFQKNQESLGSFASFPNHRPPIVCIISETKQRRSEPNPSRFRPSGRKRKRNKVGCLRG
jgi:hypothetical protein